MKPAYAVKTPEAETACFSEAEVQKIVREYCDLHGEDTLARDVSVHLMTEKTGVGQPIDPRAFL